jgi:RNA polymerase sigma factor (sigma-70 family)
MDSLNNFIDDRDNQNLSDSELLRAFLKGDQWALEAFYERFHRLVVWVMNKTIRISISGWYSLDLTTEDRQDCEQHIWFCLMEKNGYRLRKWREETPLASWIYYCAASATQLFLKSLKRHREREINDPPIFTGSGSGASPESKTSRQQILEKIKDIIENRLSNRDKLFASLYWHEEATYDEISKIMHCNKAHLMVIKFRVEQKIKRLLKL